MAEMSLTGYAKVKHDICYDIGCSLNHMTSLISVFGCRVQFYGLAYGLASALANAVTVDPLDKRINSSW
jgi:hypothetical protein